MPATVHSRTVDTALRTLDRVYPDFRSMIEGRDVVDFGCGWGHQAVAMAHIARSVTAIDIGPLEPTRERAERAGVSVDLYRAPPPGLTADVVVSLNSMEHYTDPLGALLSMRSMLRPDGVALVTFGPPWLAPFGHHCHHFLPVPWLHLMVPEPVVMRIRGRYHDDGATRYEEVTGGLNRMTLGKFERLVELAGLRPVRTTYDTVKASPMAVTRVPVLRELLTNRVSAVLRV